MSGRLIAGAHHQSSATRDRYASHDSILVSAGSPLERSGFFQALFDIFALIFIALFLCGIAISFPVALFCLLFVWL